MTIAEQFEQRGLVNGMELGIERGIERGANNMQMKMVKKILQRKMNSTAIAELSDLTPAEINKIAADLEEKIS
jgi:predicted transposase/invertase (TIGR01784 family)